MPSITVSTVQANGYTVRVRTVREQEQDHQERPPYVLVHGLGMTHRYLDRLAADLSADAVVHSIDLPGFGDDPQPREQLDVEDHGSLIVAALSALGVDRCILVGHSMGAQFVTAAALHSPGLAEGVVLLGPVVDRLRRTVLQQTVSLLLDTFRESPRANLMVSSDYFRTGVRWYSLQLMSMMKYPLERAVERLTCPVLVMRGARDPVSQQRWCRELAGRAANGTFVEIPGHAHVVQLQAAVLVATEITAFRRRSDAAHVGILLQASDGRRGNLKIAAHSGLIATDPVP